MLNDCDLFVECNGKCTNVNRKILVNNDSFGIMEFLFNEIANFQINRILKNKDKENLKLVEKQIILNLADENNIIKEEENPLFYNIQPYMMYKNLYISECFNELFSSIFSIFKEDDNYFEEYVQYCKKYDVDSIVKKVEILTGENFAKVYDKLVGDMQKIKTRQ